MADDKNLVSQDEIERLLQQASSGVEAPKTPPPASSLPSNAALDQSDIEALLGAAVGGNPAKSSGPPSAGKEPSSPLTDADRVLAQEDIEKLLSQSGKPASKPQEPAAKEKEKPAASRFPGEGEIAPGDIEFLLNQAEKALKSVTAERPEAPPHVFSFQLPEFGGVPASAETATLDLISDVELDLRIELGRTNLYLEDVLKLRKGSVVPLDKLAGDPVDIFVNGRLIARGEVLVLNDNFCVRVAELIATANPAP
jgi:flagellar motor switch protein FliN/FliY